MSLTITPVASNAPVTGTYVLPNDTAEHDVFEIPKQGIVHNIGIRVDLSAITKANFRLRLYFKIDGTNYVLHSTSTYGASDNMGQFEELAASASAKVTAQSTIAESAPRSLPWRYSLVRQ